MSIEMKILNSREEWLANRMNGIGGSEISAVVGCNPYKSNIDLWMEKTGQAQAKDISNEPYVLYGTKAEEHLRALFALDFPQYEVHYIDAMSYTAKKNTHKKDKEGNTIYSTIGSYSNLNDAVKSIYYNKAINIWYKTIVMLSELGEEMDKKLEELNI